MDEGTGRDFFMGCTQYRIGSVSVRHQWTADKEETELEAGSRWCIAWHRLHVELRWAVTLGAPSWKMAAGGGVEMPRTGPEPSTAGWVFCKRVPWVLV